MRILVATDAWYPQINGVVRSYERTAEVMPQLGAEMSFLTPEGFRSLPMPTYSEIRLAMPSQREITRRIEEAAPDHVHIATEGPIGLLTRRWCLREGRAFTTCYHSRFPEYVSARFPVPRKVTYAFLRRFHNAGRGVMVATPTLAATLEKRRFSRIQRWSRGVDSDLFRPRSGADLGLPRPVFMFVGRVAVEKNLEAFLSLDLPGTKVIVGGGPALGELQSRFPAAVFTGPKEGEDLAEAYAAADVFVFPSLTDTFGMVLLEALAAGVPVAAYPVMGPLDVLGDAPVGVLDPDLRKACLAALDISREDCRAFALKHSWRACTQQFLDNVRAAEAEHAADRLVA